MKAEQKQQPVKQIVVSIDRAKKSGDDAASWAAKTEALAEQGARDKATYAAKRAMRAATYAVTADGLLGNHKELGQHFKPAGTKAAEAIQKVMAALRKLEMSEEAIEALADEAVA